MFPPIGVYRNHPCGSVVVRTTAAVALTNGALLVRRQIGVEGPLAGIIELHLGLHNVPELGYGDSDHYTGIIAAHRPYLDRRRRTYWPPHPPKNLRKKERKLIYLLKINFP